MNFACEISVFKYIHFVTFAQDRFPDNVEELKRLLIIANKNIESIQKEKEGLRNENTFLNEKLKILQAKLFGRKSEKLTPEEIIQSRLFDEVEISLREDLVLFSEETKIKIESHERKKPGRKPLPEELHREDVIHDISEEEKTCGCGHEKIKIGEETSEKLNIIPAKIFVEKHIRYKYACNHCEGENNNGPSVVTAPLPDALIPKSLATSGLLAYIFTSKFVDHTPYYRLERIFFRMGIELTRATMSNWSVKVYEKVSLLEELLKKELLSRAVIGIDETTLQVMNEKDRKNSVKSYMWVFRGYGRDGPVLYFLYQPTRSGKFLPEFLNGYSGVAQSDGFSGYNILESNEKIIQAGCMAHVRRKFMDAKKASPTSKSASFAVELIRKMYRIEDDIRKKNLSPEDVLKIRQEKTKPLMDAFREFLVSQTGNVTPRSSLGGAVHYAISEWKKLVVFLENGNTPIDNNLVENAIRPFVIGRKNWLFSGHPDGAQASAFFYTLIENAKACGFEQYWYLRYLLENIMSAKTEEEYRKLLPQYIDPAILKPRMPSS